MSTNLLYLPVSIGEAIDKLTILHIKLSKIKDNRINDVHHEYNLLYDKLKEVVINYKELYETMKKVNLLIWDMMDILRDGNVDETEYLKICKECIEFNDIRFRIKNKINHISDSVLKEQKSYKINRLVIIINKKNIDNTILNIIKYFSYMYDEIFIVCKYDSEYLKTQFNYDNTIKFIENELFEYKCKVIIEDKEYSDNEIYKLFNITEKEIKKII